MSTVREAVFDLLRDRGMTTIFGNPGSTELPMLAEFPEDFRYVLGLQEAVAVGMADGFAQASGRPALVNLHTAPGVGNGMGAIFNAQANKTPLVVTAGQQVRALMTLQANLTNRDAARMPHPLVKWSYEPPRAEDVPHAIARDRKSTRLNSSHVSISYAVFCLKKKNTKHNSSRLRILLLQSPHRTSHVTYYELVIIHDPSAHCIHIKSEPDNQQDLIHRHRCFD